MLGRRLAEVEKEEVTAWAEKQGLSRYFGSSLKGEAGIDWDDKGQREQLLTEIVQDGPRLLSLAEEIQKQHPAQTEAIAAAAALLLRLIAQDVEEKPGGGIEVSGTAKDRVLSVHDPEMRHGRKSASKRFNGHKAAVAVEMESQLITGVEVLAGNAGDQEKALELVQQSERVLEAKVEETVGDCAYGGGPTRRVFAEEERILTAKVPASHNRNCFSKSEFEIDLDQMEVRCPAGQSTRDYRSAGEGRGGQFLFSRPVVRPVPCARNASVGKGRGVSASKPKNDCSNRPAPITRPRRGSRACASGWVVEHRIARLVGLGIRQSRYFGKKKTRWQVVMAAVVANLSLVVGYCQRRAQSPDAATAAQASVQPTHVFLAVLSTFRARFLRLNANPDLGAVLGAG